MAVRGNADSNFAFATLATVASLAVGWLDLHTTEVIVAIGALLVSGMVLGLVRPTGAWRWAVWITLGLPVLEVAAELLHLHTAEPVHLDPRIWLVALGFALVGSYTGALLGRAVRNLAGGSVDPR